MLGQGPPTVNFIHKFIGTFHFLVASQPALPHSRFPPPLVSTPLKSQVRMCAYVLVWVEVVEVWSRCVVKQGG